MRIGIPAECNSLKYAYEECFQKNLREKMKDAWQKMIVNGDEQNESCEKAFQVSS
jgi:hypothetical protein